MTVFRCSVRRRPPESFTSARRRPPRTAHRNNLFAPATAGGERAGGGQGPVRGAFNQFSSNPSVLNAYFPVRLAARSRRDGRRNRYSDRVPGSPGRGDEQGPIKNICTRPAKNENTGYGDRRRGNYMCPGTDG